MGLFKKEKSNNDPKFWDTLSGMTKAATIAAGAVKASKWLSIGKDILDARNGCDCIEDDIIEESVADVAETM